MKLQEYGMRRTITLILIGTAIATMLGSVIMTNKKQYEFIIKTQQDLILRMSNLNDWHLDANKKVMRTETDNWYLRWKVDYLEEKIKEHLPNIALYNKDDMLFDQVKKEQHDKN
jgi:hypothetical protein